MRHCKLTRKEKTVVKLGLSMMLNVILTAVIAVCLTYGAAFGGQYSFGLSELNHKSVILLYSDTGVINYWVVSEEAVSKDRAKDFVSWELNGNTYWSAGTIVVLEAKNPEDIDYQNLTKEYGATEEQVEGIKKKLKD